MMVPVHLYLDQPESLDEDLTEVWSDAARAASAAVRRARGKVAPVVSGRAARRVVAAQASSLMDERRRVTQRRAARNPTSLLDRELSKLDTRRLTDIDRQAARLAPSVRRPRLAAAKSLARSIGRRMRRLFVTEANSLSSTSWLADQPCGCGKKSKKHRVKG